MVVRTVRGSRSEKYAANDWVCKTCGTLNKKKEYLVFDLPPFYCERCRNKYDGLVYFCLADVEVNGHSILPEVKNQGDKPECVSFAFAHAQEFNDIIENIILGDESPIETLDPMMLSEAYYHIFPGGVNRLEHKMLYVGLLLKDCARSSPKDVERSTFSEVAAVGIVNFEHICRCIADGRGVVGCFAVGKNFHRLKFGQVYQTPATDKTEFHAVMLIGAIRYLGRDILIFLNSWGKEFCALLDEDGKIIVGGIGMFEFDLSTNLIVLSRSWERALDGKLSGSWSKNLTREELNLEMACLAEPTNQMPTFAVKEINASGCYDEEPDDQIFIEGLKLGDICALILYYLHFFFTCRRPMQFIANRRQK